MVNTMDDTVPNEACTCCTVNDCPCLCHDKEVVTHEGDELDNSELELGTNEENEAAEVAKLEAIREEKIKKEIHD